jgi:pimeloyl-ACP methyl ester carboxylesterase
MKINNGIYFGSKGKQALFDLEIPENFNGTVLYFVHGYKGYKDWGAWNLIAQSFIEQGYGFAKCNLPFNGTTLTHPTEFKDLDAFAENRYTYEIDSFLSFVRFVDDLLSMEYKDYKKIYIGHSRGGGDVVLANQKLPADGMITWAAISDIENRFLKGKELKDWEEKGVYYVKNGRTGQEMPHNFSFYEDFIQHKEELNIEKAAKATVNPWLIIHAQGDLAVSIDEAKNLKSWQPKADIEIILESNHVFDAYEPFSEKVLPAKSKELVDLSLTWLQNI